ncbi:MAG TPA: S46 family peptidase, partial [Bacteroidota bacterium]|nr:S46 family peptidase [Bacteroidota bacterium]
MKKSLLLLPILVFFTIIFTTATFTDEGQWMLTQLDKLPWAEMKKRGLELTAEQIYNPNGTSLKDAIVLLGGGTASFVSPEGLILTNHHVAYGAIQSVSSVQEDYLKNGFHAKTKEEELSIPTYTAQIVISIKDVTTEVLSAVNDTMSGGDRTKAIQAKSREIEKIAKGESQYEYRISETYNGVKYILFGYEVLKDVRLVYAPPTAIGNYGGEVDNWYWPRHTGDFSFMRAYVAPDGKSAKYAKENVPYHPKVFLPISTKGFKENSFAMIMGFPGRTFRYRTAPEIQLSKDESLPLTMELFKKRMDIIEGAGKNDRAVEIKYSGRWRGLANTYKNFQGTLEGMKRANLIKRRQAEEQNFIEFLLSKPELEKKYGTIITDIATTYGELQAINKKQIVLNQITTGVDILRLATQFKNFANSFSKDTTGAIRPSESSMKETKDAISNTFRNVELNVDKAILTALIAEATKLPKNQKITAVQRIVGNNAGPDAEERIRNFVDDLYDDTRFTTTEGCEKMMTKSAGDILDDEFVKFVLELDKDNTPLQTQMGQFNPKIGALRTKLIEAIMEWKGKDIYPDANRTLRLTHGMIKSYKPRDAVYYNYITTLGGVIEKESGEDPFIVPPKLKGLWELKDFGQYADPELGDVPVAFLANLDITGGNSGSPVINGKGEFIGIAFDGNWEAVVGDYLYQDH